MSRIERSSRRVPSGLATLPPNERKLVHNLEMTHGVVVSKDDEGRLLARHWRDDDVLADADSVYELETVLKCLHIYAGDDVEPADLIPDAARTDS